MTRGLALLGLVLAVGVVGCGFEDPYAGDEPPKKPPKAVEGAPAAAAERDEHSEEPQPTPPPEPAEVPEDGGAPSASEAAERYTVGFTNWTWRDVVRRSERVLAPLAAEDLRELVKENISELRDDATLRRDRAANRGELVALDEQGDDPARRTVWVVMRETASTAALAAASDKRLAVYRVTVEQLDGGRWYVTGFEPQA